MLSVCKQRESEVEMSFTDEERLRIEEFRTAFSFDSNDRRIAQDRYSDGRSSARQRAMTRRNRSIKHDKQWRSSVQERSVLRYTTGG